MARKKKFNFTGSRRLVEKKKTTIEALRKTAGNVSKACEYANISRTEFYRWKTEDPEFRKQVENIYESIVDFAESALLSQIREGNTTAIIFFLKTKGKHRGYVERQEIEGKDIEINVEIKREEENEKSNKDRI